MIVIISFVVLFLVFIAFVNNRVTSKSEIKDLERRVAQLEKDSSSL